MMSYAHLTSFSASNIRLGTAHLILANDGHEGSASNQAKHAPRFPPRGFGIYTGFRKLCVAIIPKFIKRDKLIITEYIPANREYSAHSTQKLQASVSLRSAYVLTIEE